QRVVSGAVHPGQRLPFVEEDTKAVGAGAPVTAFGDLLRLRGDTVLTLPGLFKGLGAFGLTLGSALGDVLVDGVEPGAQCAEVTDGVSVGDHLANLGRAGSGVVGSCRAGLKALFEEIDLHHDVVVLALEERQCLCRFADLPRADRPLAVWCPDENLTAGVDASPF